MKMTAVLFLISFSALAQVNYQDITSDRYWAEKETKTPEQAKQNLEVCTKHDEAPVILPQEEHDLTFDACKHAILDAVESGVSDKEIIDTLIKGDDGSLQEKESEAGGANPYIPDYIKG